MMLISTTEYQYWPQLSPRSVLVFSGGYHVLSNTSIVNNCILLYSLKIDCLSLAKSCFQPSEYI